jgi:glycerate 2-kinase
MTSNINRLKQVAIDLFQHAIQRADPARAVFDGLARHPLPEVADGGRIFVVAVGKAAIAMMREALKNLPPVYAAVAITNPENEVELPGARVFTGSHPVPDESSARAGQAVLNLLSETQSQDQVVALISGGGSALMVAPVPGISLSDKMALNQALLGSGLDINDMNLIRQHLSELKGGGLLKLAAPAQVHAYLLSDVIGDDLRAIASGPTVSRIGSRADARDLLTRTGLWKDLSSQLRTYFEATETAEIPVPEPYNHLIGSNRQSLDAVYAAARGWFPQIVDDHLTGDVQGAAERVLKAALGAPSDRPTALIFGGETTVQLTGTGTGGRNQELALRFAKLGAQNLNGDWVFLSGGTDGRDGPTEAAGGLITPTTWQDIRDAGNDPDALLHSNDSNTALKAADALLVTGGTGTNVADIQIFLRSGAP